MDIQDAVEMIIDQVVNGEWGDVDGDDFSRLRAENYIPDADAVIPYSRMLCTKDVSQARSELRGKVEEMRRALDGLEAFLDAIDAAEGEAAAHGHPEWAPLIALLKVPFPLEKPEVYDPDDTFNVFVMLRDTLFNGDWEQQIAWIELQGGPEQKREDLPLARSLQAFEKCYEVNLSDLLFNDLDRAEHERIRKENAEHPPEGLWPPVVD